MSGRQQSGGPQIRQQQVELGNHVGLTGGVRHSGGRGDNARRTLGAGRAGGTNRADRALRAGCASSAGRTLRAGRTSGTSGADRTLRAGRASSASSSRRTGRAGGAGGTRRTSRARGSRSAGGAGGAGGARRTSCASRTNRTGRAGRTRGRVYIRKIYCLKKCGFQTASLWAFTSMYSCTRRSSSAKRNTILMLPPS